MELLVAYLNEKAKNADSIYTIDWGIGFQLRALCRPKVGQKVKDSWAAFLGGSLVGQTAQLKLHEFSRRKRKRST